MFKEEFETMTNAAAGKVAYLRRNPVGYFCLAMLAGAYIGFGILLIFTIGGQLGGAPATKTVMGCAFGIALSLVVIAGAELFTGNTMVMSGGIMTGKVKIGEAAMLWIVCWIGNLVGGIILALIFHATGLQTGAVLDFIAAGAAAKMGAGAGELFARGILCNILVCLAVWCSFRCKSDAGKLIMCFWCLFAFITCGFEHSVANMTLLTAALLAPGDAAVSIGGWFYNLLIVTLGNMVGGICFVALPYFAASRERK